MHTAKQGPRCKPRAILRGVTVSFSGSKIMSKKPPPKTSGFRHRFVAMEEGGLSPSSNPSLRSHAASFYIGISTFGAMMSFIVLRRSP